MPHLRAFRPGDEPALAEICLKTADAGGDATGVLDDDAIWAEIFVLPYVARHPEFAFVVESDDGRVVGYIVAAPDTEAFEAWFHTVWWPERGGRRPLSAEGNPRQSDILRYAAGRSQTPGRFSAEYPAHLHIDLLPETQGGGWGRRLIEALVTALREAGVPGVHLAAAPENAGAIAFYPRVGFDRLPSEPDVVAFGRRL
ncbi:GNAT family N-acetyltransferase [Microbacterium sp. P03]|uniref:GNAT family N-acetyltransferase n=1 Tax=Microbacterium sp. P03 TaxID=3366946 RepID=UPI00374543F9